MTATRSKTKPGVPDQADIDRAMAKARQNVAAMTGNQELLQAEPAKGRMQKRGNSRPASVVMPSAPPLTTEELPRRKGLFGSIFGRRNSDVSAMSPSPVLSRQNTFTSGQDSTPPMTPLSGRGKLQRKNAPVRTASSTATATVDSTRMAPVAEGGEESIWPLAQPPKTSALQNKTMRPSTSDGVPASERTKPAVAAVVPQNGNVAGDAGAKGEKKKRFGKLRRAFGL